MLLARCTLGAYGGDGCFSFLDGIVGVGCSAFGGPAVAQPGVAGLVTGLPRGRSQRFVQVAFELAYGSRVGLPCLHCLPELRLHLMERLGRRGPPLLSVGDAVEELLSLLGDLCSPRSEPAREEIVCLGSGLRAVRLGEKAALGDGGDIGPVVGQDGVEDVTGLAHVVGVGDDVDPVLVSSSGGGHVQAAVGGGR